MKKVLRLALLIGLPVIELWGYTLDYSPAEFSFYKENGFDRIKALNFALIGENQAHLSCLRSI